MTRLADAVDQASGTPAPPALARSRRRRLTDLLADPRVRLGVGTVALLATAVAAHRDRVGPCEAAAFQAVNGLPDSVYPPAWAVMQLGTLGAAPAAAGMAWLAGDRELAGRLLVSGTGAWALSKVVKRIVRRPRPANLVPGTRRRGREAAGLGYLSGHAGVAAALGAAAFPQLGRPGRALTLSAVPVVGLTRIYVGAHLPLDVAGGAALGLVVEAAITLVSVSLDTPSTQPGEQGHCSQLKQLQDEHHPCRFCVQDGWQRLGRQCSPADGPSAVPVGAAGV